jgi:hypothetical protein
MTLQIGLSVVMAELEPTGDTSPVKGAAAMTNLYTQAERRDRVVNEVVDLTVHNNKVWLADLFAGVVAIIFFWR